LRNFLVIELSLCKLYEVIQDDCQCLVFHNAHAILASTVLLCNSSCSLLIEVLHLVLASFEYAAALIWCRYLSQRFGRSRFSITPGSSQKILANVPLSTRELRNRLLKKSDFVFLLSHTKLLTSIAYKLKQLFSYFTHRMTSLSL